MRIDSAAFAARNTAAAKEPRFVIELAFDSENTLLWYFTSHADTALPQGALAIQNVIEGLTVTSQTLNPDTANATIGSIAFNLVDRHGEVSSVLGDALSLGRSTRLQRVRVYTGFVDSSWSDYVLIQTQIVDQISWLNGVYTFKCLDVQREMREQLFELATTTLQSGVGLTDTTINVFNTARFELLAHGSSYSDAPNSVVGYLRIDDEVIRYSGKTATAFLGCVRGALNTRAAEHPVDVSQSQDRRTKVEEVVYLELPAVKLVYALLTGTLYGQANATLPASWQLGIPESFVRLENFLGIGPDLWDPLDDEQGFIVRFVGVTKRKGKEFIERELLLLAGLYMPIYSDGALGLKRMASVLAGAAYVKQLDDSNIVSHGELTHDFGSLHNIIQVDWNHEFVKSETTRTNLLIDADSVTIYGRADPVKLKFLGLHGLRHSSTTLQRLFDALRDRYTGPPLRFAVECLPSLNVLEVGDVVRVRLADVSDFVANGTLDRSFEVQNDTIDWLNGNVRLSLFASSRAAKPMADSGDATVLPDSWYVLEGTDLASVLTITGSNPGHVTANGAITGTTHLNAPSSIFYYNGDLQIDPDVTVTVVGNVQLRIRGHFQNNGVVTGRGHGIAGAAAVALPISRSHNNPGTPGFLGTTEAGGALVVPSVVSFISLRAPTVVGANSVMPSFNIAWDGEILSGLPTDLRGTSGSSGLPITRAWNFAQPESYPVAGGAGGNGGAGLVIVSRGLAQGVSARIDLSGGDGLAGSRYDIVAASDAPPSNSWDAFPGSGAGGAPGGLLILVDGANNSVTGLTESGFIAENGKTPIPAEIAGAPSGGFAGGWHPGTKDNGFGTRDGSWYSYFIGTGDGTTFPVPSLSGARGGSRVQYVPRITGSDPDPSATLPAPANFGLASGTAELLVLGDGTIVPRVRITWNAVSDPRVRGYEIRYRHSLDVFYSYLSPILHPGTTGAWLTGIQDGERYDIAIRAVGDVRATSEWVEITDYLALGKTEPPSDVTGLTVSQNGAVLVFQWNPVADLDLASYEIRYGVRVLATWSDALPVTRATLGTQVTSAAVPPGDWRFFIKARDTSGNESQNSSAADLVVTTPFDVIHQREQAPDWLGAKTHFRVHWTGVLIPDSTRLASEHTNEELFEQFVPYPQPLCMYEAPQIDIGFDDTVRVWGSIDAALGPGVETGLAEPVLEVDFRSDAGAYDGFEPWLIGDRVGRFVKHRVVLDTTLGRAKIRGFLPTVDQLERTESREVVIAPNGSVISFENPFHFVPGVMATLVQASALFVGVSNVTSATFTANVYNSAGQSVGGAIRYHATGV